jgi:hypothetical protein
MDKYDIRKAEKKWNFMKEGEDQPLKTFATKKQAEAYGRDYLRQQGGVLRIWKSDGISLQEERTFEKEARSFYSGILDGVGDAAKAVEQFMPTVGSYVSKGVYEAGYYASYGVVFGASMLARLIPLPNPLSQGVHDGAEAALGSAEKTHHTDKAEHAAS